MRLTLGFSPCPNDTFIFDAMVHHKIDTEGLEFNVTLADVEELNNKAFHSELDITKVSYHAFIYLTQSYNLLDSGSALGFGAGPLLIAAEVPEPEALSGMTIALPGRFTTANLLFSLAYPDCQNKVFRVFSEIEEALQKKEADAGVIIHENRFTYQAKGLKKIADLGDFWEKSTGFPVPLGGIVIKNSIPEEQARRVNRVLRKSVEYALAHSNTLPDFVTCNAQEMSPEVMRQHIGLYVNLYTVSLGEVGYNAIKDMVSRAVKAGLINSESSGFNRIC